MRGGPGLTASGRALLAVLLLGACAMPGREDTAVMLSFADLAGWESADHRAALLRHRGHCAQPEAPCAEAPPVSAGDGRARAVIEATYRPVILPGGENALVTGYYEPVLDASPVPTARYAVPLHAPPPGLAPGEAGPDRGAIAGGALDGRGLELFWLADPVDRFFLQIQGSGRLRLPDGRFVRLGYAGRNGHPYRSIGRLLVERGEMAPGTVTAERLRRWLRADPERGRALMNENPSYIFFREVEGLSPESGPVGSAGVPLAPMLSVAADPEHYPPGSLLWLEADTPDGPIRQLAVAEDTGSAIRGTGRVDLFHGTGDKAGAAAGALAARGRLVLLAPRRPEPDPAT